ncbi:sialate O-acetylesterase [Nibrella saemangeumensis]|uniref:Sialate O-acetylesterase n=1 Tax=Nibrella saemangeumensis TaxID=1084526 RepID=A0ABP8MHW1_9BACT
MTRYFLLSLFSLLWVCVAVAQPAAFSGRKVHLYLLAGQSNMAGRGKVDAESKQTHPRVWMLDQAGKWVPATDPMHFDKPAVIGVGPGLTFGRLMAEADTSVVIGLVPVAVGGSAIDSWIPGGYHDQTKSYPYDDALRRAKLAQQAGVYRGILWHQGESDSKPELTVTYTQKFIKLAERLRTELNAPEVPIVVGTLGDFFVVRNADAATINQILKALPQRVPGLACVDATGLTHLGDNTHFDTASARELGRRYALAMQQLQRKLK